MNLEYCFDKEKINFIPTYQISYWLSDAMLSIFKMVSQLQSFSMLKKVPIPGITVNIYDFGGKLSQYLSMPLVTLKNGFHMQKVANLGVGMVIKNM